MNKMIIDYGLEEKVTIEDLSLNRYDPPNRNLLNYFTSLYSGTINNPSNKITPDQNIGVVELRQLRESFLILNRNKDDQVEIDPTLLLDNDAFEGLEIEPLELYFQSVYCRGEIPQGSALTFIINVKADGIQIEETEELNKWIIFLHVPKSYACNTENEIFIYMAEIGGDEETMYIVSANGDYSSTPENESMNQACQHILKSIGGNLLSSLEEND